MKKLLLFIFALFLWTGAWADGLVNHAYGLIPTVLSAATTPNAEHLAYLTDGDFGMPYAETKKSAAFGSTNPTIFYYDLGSKKAIGRISISWTGAHARNYKIYAVNEAPADAEAASALTGEIVNATDVSVPSQTNKVVSYDVTTTAQYIVFVATSFEYGCTMHEFAVYSEAYEQVFSSFVSKSGTYVYNAAQQVDLLLLDQEGASFEGSVTSISFANSTYGYDKNLSNPSFTFGADFPSAFDELSVTVGGVTRTRGFGFLNNTPAVGDVPAIDDETSYVIFSTEKKEKHEVFDAYDGDNTTVLKSDFKIGENNTVLARTMTYVGFRNNTFSPSKTDMTSLVLDIFVTEPHAKENCHVKAEGKSTLDFPQDLNQGWNHVVLTNFNASTIAGLTSNITLFVRIDDAADEDVVIYNLYYSTASTAKSVTFNNASWGNVRVYAWYVDNGNQVVTNAWPGDAVDACAEGNTLTNNGDGTFTWTTTAEPTMIIFNNGSGTQTGNLKFEDGETYNSNGIVGKYGYFIVGDNTSWNVDTDYKMVRNLDQDGEYMFRKISLNAGNKIKIVYSGDGETINTWFPDGSDNEYTVSENGNYNIYFKPAGGVEGWHEGYFYVEKRTYEVEIDGNKATITGTINAGNSWNIKTDVGMSTYVDVSGATLETYFSTDNPNALYLYATNGEAEAATKTPNPVHYDGARFYYAPKGVTLVDAPASYSFPENAFSGISPEHMVTINRSIEGNKYVTSFMGRTASPGFPMVATLASGLEAYELTAAEAGQLTFTKVTGALETNKGYVIHNTTSDPLTLTWDSHQNDQIYLDYAENQNPENVVAVNDVKIIGTMHTVTTNGSQWILSGGEIKKGNGAMISPYRAYFTGVTPASGKASAVFVDGETTKIGSINANGEINVENGAVYNLAGQRVAHPTKGLYIVNGKKVLIK